MIYLLIKIPFRVLIVITKEKIYSTKKKKDCASFAIVNVFNEFFRQT